MSENNLSIEENIKNLKSDSHPVRFKAAQNLGKMGSAAVNPLIEALKDSGEEEKRFILFALKEIGDESVIDHFIESLNDADWGVRKVAARALGELGNPRAIEHLDKALDDEDWGVKLAAVRSLGDLEDEAGIAPIKRVRRKIKDKDFKKAANKAIKKIEKANGLTKTTKKGKAKGLTEKQLAELIRLTQKGDKITERQISIKEKLTKKATPEQLKKVEG